MGLEIHYNVFGCFREPGEDIELAKAAVDAGFEGIWIGDHFLPWIDSRPYTHHVLPWFGALMNEIPSVPVGTSVTCPMLRYRPPILAQALATLDNMSPGRLNLGVGTGEAFNEVRFLDDWPSWETRAEMLAESIDLMDGLWRADHYIDHHGDHFDYDRMRLYTQPKEKIPVHWAGSGPKSCFMAGKHADHLITGGDPETIEEKIIPDFERGLEEAGRSLEEADVTTEFSANVGDPDDVVAAFREAGEHIPGDSELNNPDPRSIQRVADKRLAEMSDEEIRESNNVTEDPEEFVTQLERLESAGVSRVLVGTQCGDPRDTIELFEEEVLPEFA